MFHKLTEDQELEIERNREKAKAGLRTMRGVLKWIGLLVLASFLYFAGEKAGVESCQAYWAPLRPK